MLEKTAFALLATSFVVAAACTRQDGKGVAPIKPPPRSCAAAPAEDGKMPPGVSGADVECKLDSECTAGRQGRCSYSGGGHAASVVACTYDDCAGDADCAAGKLCLCGAGGSERNSCSDANCHDDADCGGKTCAPSWGGVKGTPGRYCHVRGDACTTASDCSGDETCNYVAASSRWECMVAAPHPVGRNAPGSAVSVVRTVSLR